MRVVLMAVGDLAYNDILPATVSPDDGNVSSYYALLRSQYGEFPFVRDLPHSVMSAAFNVSPGLIYSAEQGDADTDHLLFPFLSYVVYIFFALLMPVVVLNTLVCHSSNPLLSSLIWGFLFDVRLVWLLEILQPFKQTQLSGRFECRLAVFHVAIIVRKLPCYK